ncbi:MAG: TIGR03756 family integrating conjugative element protein [Gammaproteobacteria bacterium]|nr:TIGR03756 family integrating conjugative element protein [Gammaproteobacteria bacterium]
MTRSCAIGMARRTFAAACLALAGVAHAAETVTSADILAASADADCLDYRPVGGCLWLRCSGVPPSCTTTTSVKYRHYVPDAVVTAYPAAGLSPWTEMRAVDGAAEGGTYAKGAGSRASTGLRFKVAQAIGSPGIAWIEALDLATTVCEPAATPLEPYYASGLDPMWRTPEAQGPLTLRHMLRAVREPGPLGSLWGTLYPRTGFVQQVHDYKAAAVVAQRVANIVTRRNQPHVYRPLLGDSGGGEWPPGAVVEGDADTHKWQLLAPRTGSCSVFAASAAPPVGIVDPLGPNVAASGAYAWNLWRPYRCCARRGQWLLSDWGN